MDRKAMIQRIADSSGEEWDVVVVGGGATGLGTAMDAVTRGYRTLLLEGGDFAKGTSSRSTKIIHGGVRYLRQGNIRLVRDSLRERGLLMRNCPDLVKERLFLVPHYRWWERFFYGIGLWLYDRLAGGFGLSRSRRMSREEIYGAMPTLNRDKLRGGTAYADGQFDDARLSVALARTISEHGGGIANYIRVTGLLKGEGGKVSGVRACDLESGVDYEIRSRCVINATGVFSDAIRQMDDASCGTLVAPSQGIHLVFERSIFPGEDALMIPKTDDGRLLFAIPWNGKVLVGTTDTPRVELDEEPRPLEGEIRYLLEHLGRYLNPAPERGDILSAFAGLRPLVKPSGKSKATSKVSRDHTIEISESGLVTIVGGKWTTFRHMAEDVVDRAAASAGLPGRECGTKRLAISGGALPEVGDESGGEDLIHPELGITGAHVLGAVRNEMARTVEDVLARRTRALFLNARASLEAAPKVAEWMAQELGRDAGWRDSQVAGFRSVAEGYLGTGG